MVNNFRKASRVLKGSRVKTYRKASRHKKNPKIINCKRTITVT